MGFHILCILCEQFILLSSNNTYIQMYVQSLSIFCVRVVAQLVCKMATKSASCTNSYLSHDVYELIVAVPPGTSYITGRFLALDLSMNWDEIKSMFKSGKL